MKEIKSKSGQTEIQTDEYAPDGPVRLPPVVPDTRGRLNGDGSKSAIVPERPTYTDPMWIVREHEALVARVRILEAQVASLQVSAPRRLAGSP